LVFSIQDSTEEAIRKMSGKENNLAVKIFQIANQDTVNAPRDTDKLKGFLKEKKGRRRRQCT
jgi:hypothetical protein